MTLLKRAIAAAIATLMLIASSPAFAQTGATLVVIVTADPHAALTRRVRAELEALGVDVMVLNPPAESTAQRAPLENAARNVGAVAAVRLVPSSEGKVEVWVADRVTGKAVVRELDASGSSASDAAVAVGTVELLRASLMELHSAEPPRGEVAATEKVRSLALPVVGAPSAPRLGLFVGGGVEPGLRGVGLSIDANLALWIRIASTRFGARLLGSTTLSPARVDTPSGSIEVRSQLFGAALGYDFADASAAWVPTFAVGAAAAHVSTTGTATPPFVSASEDAWSPAPFASAGVAWSFARGLRLRSDALAAWTLAATHVRTPTSDAARWGAPQIVLSLGVEVMWAP